MRKIALIGLLLLAGLSVRNAAAADFPVPDLPKVHAAVVAARPDLALLSSTVEAERKALLTSAGLFSKACANVEKGSAQHVRCESEFGVLMGTAQRHCRSSVAFIQAYLQAIPSVLATNAQDKTRVMQQLRNLQARFQSQVTGFDSWGADAQRGYEKAIEQIIQAPLAPIGGAALSLTEAQYLAKTDQLIRKARAVNKRRRIKSPDLQPYLLELKARLQGKSPAEAKRIVIAQLQADRQLLVEAKLAGNQAIDSGLRHTLPDDHGLTVADGLGDAYSAILTGTQVAASRGAKAVAAIARLEASYAAIGALGIVALLPSVVDASLLTFEAFVDESNVDALSELQRLTEQERRAASAALVTVVTHHRELEAEQVKLRTLARYQCP